MIHIGIDPGKHGCVAALDGDGTPLDYHDTPVLRGQKSRIEYDVPRMIALIRKLAESKCRVTVEIQQAYPGQGSTSNFTCGYGYGLWVGILSTLLVPYQLVTPARWHRALLADLPGKDTKRKAVQKCQQLWPGEVAESWVVGPRGGLRDGRADALLIAEWGRKR